MIRTRNKPDTVELRFKPRVIGDHSHFVIKENALGNYSADERLVTQALFTAWSKAGSWYPVSLAMIEVIMTAMGVANVSTKLATGLFRLEWQDDICVIDWMEQGLFVIPTVPFVTFFESNFEKGLVEIALNK